MIAGILLVGSSALADSVKVEMTRNEAIAAYNALLQIGQYQTSVKQGGQDVAVPRFLDVSTPMRTTLVRDMLALDKIRIETAKLTQDARARASAGAASIQDDKARADAEAAALEREAGVLAQEKVTVEGVTLFAETDLQYDKNPQITPALGAALAVLETSAAAPPKP